MATIHSLISELSQKFVTKFPDAVYALIWLAVLYAIARIAASIVRKITVQAKLDDYIKDKAHMTFKLSDVFSVIVKWVIILVAFEQAAMILNVSALSAFVNLVVAFLLDVVMASIVLIVGYALAVYIKEDVIGSKEIYSSIMGKVVFFMILLISISTALPIMGIPAVLINNIILVLFISVGVSTAIALGWGLKDIVKELAEGYVKNYKKK